MLTKLKSVAKAAITNCIDAVIGAMQLNNWHDSGEKPEFAREQIVGNDTNKKKSKKSD